MGAIINRLGCAAEDSAETAEECGETENTADDVQLAAESVTGMFEEAIGEHPADPDEPPVPDGQSAPATPEEPGDTPPVPDEQMGSTESPPAGTPPKKPARDRPGRQNPGRRNAVPNPAGEAGMVEITIPAFLIPFFQSCRGR